MVENIVGNGENTSYQHFLHFPQCFQRTSTPGVVKNRDCLENGSTHSHTMTPFDAASETRL